MTKQNKNKKRTTVVKEIRDKSYIKNESDRNPSKLH